LSHRLGATDREELSRGEALQIMAISEENTSISVNDANLNVVLEELAAAGAESTAIVSVVGAFRAGKSFLLDIFLRYLRNTTGSEDAFPDNADDLPDWLTCGGTEICLTEGAGAPGFSWRSGRERATTGIWMFSKPFVRTHPRTGEKIAILLMDTQGMFDMQTPPALTASIFGLSTLISSYQIYNIPRQIQEDTLQQLHFFTEFSLCALREFQAGSPESPSNDGRPFQNLEFLVRDWAHFDDNWSINRCIEEMQYVLEDSLTVNVRDAGTREQIRMMFDNIGCFLLPHPGTHMTKPNWKGDLSMLEPSFLKLLNVYCHHVLDENLTTKKIFGFPVTAESLGHYIRAFTAAFIDGQVPTAMTLVEAMTSTTNLVAREKAHKRYKLTMEEICGPDKDFVDDDAIVAVDAKAQEAALSLFASTATFGKEEDIDAARRLLVEDMAETRVQMVRENKLKMDQSLVKYAPAAIVLVLALFLDKLSDYTCDWWLESCVQASSLLMFIYVGIACFFAYVVYQLHQARGGVAAMQGLIALGQATSRMGMELALTAKDATMQIRSSVSDSLADEDGK